MVTKEAEWWDYLVNYYKDNIHPMFFGSSTSSYAADQQPQQPQPQVGSTTEPARGFGGSDWPGMESFDGDFMQQKNQEQGCQSRF